MQQSSEKDGETLRQKGFVLDIDGVFLKGKTVIPGTPSALKALEKSKIPYVFVTNGGGCSEDAKAKMLSALLDVKVTEDMVLLSHTPFKSLVEKYENKRVLIIGGSECAAVANSYGFQKVVTSRQLLLEQPTSFLSMKLTEGVDVEPVDHPSEECQAALIMGDPDDWALDMQILTDVLRPIHDENNHDMLSQRVPLYASNADIVYTNEHPVPRFTQGAFVTAFKALFVAHCQTELHVQWCGKPYSIQYETAATMLKERWSKLHGDTLAPKFDLYGIGDNPLSDIRGANSAASSQDGHNWASILVKTGVWQSDADNDDVDKATYVCDDVVHALRMLGIMTD